MKVYCIDCIHSSPIGCTKNQKNGYNNCKKFRSIPVEVLKKEYYKLLISRDNPERLKYLEEKIKDFNGGTI